MLERGIRLRICISIACLAVAFWVASLEAQQKTPEKVYVGVEACGVCHPAQLSQQSASGHARSLRPAADHSLANSFIPNAPLDRKPNFDFHFSLDAKQFKVKISDGRNAIDMPIEWAFGSGGQAVTFVSQVDEDSYVEHYFTYYSGPRALDATPGHQSLEAKSLHAALGVLYKTFDPDPKIMRCFRCHSTGRLSLGSKLEIRPAELGVRCEACHGPGSLHVEAARAGDTAVARERIQNPGKFSSVGLNQLCGACHRKPAPAGTPADWSDPWNARHQPLYLAQSACFQKSQSRLSCLTCHDPHKPLEKNRASHYNGRCVLCHKPKAHPALKERNAANLAECVGCHMPEVAPKEHLRFTNHWIGIYRNGATLKPSR